MLGNLVACELDVGRGHLTEYHLCVQFFELCQYTVTFKFKSAWKSGDFNVKIKMSNFFWKIGRLVHLGPTLPRGHTQVEWRSGCPLNEPYALVCPWCHLAFRLLSFWPHSGPIHPVLCYFYSCQIETPAVKPRRLSNGPCPSLTLGLCSGCSACWEWLSYNISSVCKNSVQSSPEKCSTLS